MDRCRFCRQWISVVSLQTFAWIADISAQISVKIYIVTQIAVFFFFQKLLHGLLRQWITVDYANIAACIWVDYADNAGLLADF